MGKITESTRITYPQGGVEGQGSILLVDPLSDNDDLVIVATNNTPFHPVDHSWPDQPADEGTITVLGEIFDVQDVITLAKNLESGKIYRSEDIPVRTGKDGWAFVVGHIIKKPTEFNTSDLIGQKATLAVDESYRNRLNASHTACHLMALALNKSTTHLWNGDVDLDSLGNPHFDKLAIMDSQITTEKSIDKYRLGKPVITENFDSDKFLGEVNQIESEINKQISEWQASGAEIHMEVPSPYLDSFRKWKCDLSDGKAVIPCGGTHLSSLDELSEVTVSIQVSPEEPGITVQTIPET